MLLIISLLHANADDLSGKRCCREKPYDGRYSRWVYNPGRMPGSASTRARFSGGFRIVIQVGEQRPDGNRTKAAQGKGIP